MADIKPQEMKFLVGVLGMEDGYVLDFSDGSFAEFFQLALGRDLSEKRYLSAGRSKAKRLRAFLAQDGDQDVAIALRALWEYREELSYLQESPANQAALRQRYFKLVDRLDASATALKGAIERFAEGATLDELVAAIERDVAAGKPQVAMDRLHTYCMKKFGHVLEARGEIVGEKTPLNSRAGRYFNPIKQGLQGQHPVSDKIMRSTVEIFQLFNNVRNDASLAHEGELLAKAEAQYIFDSVIALLRFARATEAIGAP
jgi:hypothetical protein